MKRSELTRRTPLEARSELTRKTALGRSPLSRSVLHAESAERRKQPKRRRDTGPTAKVVGLVWRRDAGCCVRCGKVCHFAERGVGWSLQHRRARGMGGTRRPDTNLPQNLIVLCGSATTGCHGWVESHRAAALSNGWAAKSNSDPLRMPVRHWRCGLVELRPDGSLSLVTAEEAA